MRRLDKICVMASAVGLLAGMAFAGEGVAWKNVDAAHRLGGRQVSEGYLRGKVVLVSCWNRGTEASCEAQRRMEDVWKHYKCKPIVILGSHLGGGDVEEEAKALVEQLSLTYPVCESAGLAENAPTSKNLPFWYLVDETGKVVAKGCDDRSATEQLVIALTDMEAPKDVAAWKRLLDFEIKTIPTYGFIRLGEFRKSYPTEGKKYDAEYKRLKADAEVQKAVPLVRFAKAAKDFDRKDKKTRGKVSRTKIQMAIQKFEPLKEGQSPLVVQEVKNALADLNWALLNFPAYGEK